MNVNDSAWMSRALVARGFSQTRLNEAGIVILNTCSVRKKPEQKVASALGRIRQLTGDNPDVLVAVLGCVAQQMGTALFEHSPQVRLVAGSDGIGSAPGAIERLLDEPETRISLLDFTSHYVEREKGLHCPSAPVALVNIMQGCDNFCTYCIVPFTKGRQKSRSAEAILEECRIRLEQGAREIMLLGQNVNAFGQDKNGDGSRFAQLLHRVSALPGLERLRFTSPHPLDMREEDVAAFAEIPLLCPSLHLPLQSGSDAVLRRMGRGYTASAYVDLVQRLRKARPDMAFSTDLIVGFPGEREEDFLATLEIMRACRFMSSFSFCYSDRPGTRALRFPDKIRPEIQRERLQRLQRLQDALSREWLAARVGQRTTLLIEKRSRRNTAARGESWQGRDPYGALGHMVLPSGRDYSGFMAEAVITEAKKHSLMARQAGDLW